jgi:hypothetical protein
MASTTLLGLVAFLLLGVGHELTSTLRSFFISGDWFASLVSHNLCLTLLALKQSSLNALNKGLAVNANGKGGDDASVRDILEFILSLCKVLDVITEALAGLVFAS